MAQELKKINYIDGLANYQAEVIIIKQNAPAVLILPAWMGIDDESRNAARDLANKGYNVFIADIYGSADIPKDMEAAKKNTYILQRKPREISP